MDRLHTSRSMLFVAVSLSFLAGYVDALGFLKLGGVFISFMSGNSTRLGVSGSVADVFPALMLAGIIALFVIGVIAGSLAGHYLRRTRGIAIMTLVGGLLALSGICDAIGYVGAAVAVATMAMGAVNTLFEKDGEVSIALTYMTGTLVRMGQHIAKAMTGGAPFGWVRYFVLWAGLLCGALAGAFIYSFYGFSAIWLAVALTVAITLSLFKLGLSAA